MGELPNRIHITGASGAGTTTLAKAISDRFGHRHIDTDDYYWLPNDPPFTTKRPQEERIMLLRSALAAVETWVLSGSLCGWGDELIPRFELVVYLLTPTPIRLERLRSRELERYGADAVSRGGARHEASEAFLEWASRYDDGALDLRSRALHEAWLQKVPCPVTRLAGDRPVSELIAALLGATVAETFLGSMVTIRIDRPLGSLHPLQGFIYPVNYGFVPGVPAPDGGELDAYVLGVFEPVNEFTGLCIAVIHRTDDDDDKLVVVPPGRACSDDEIRTLTEFQEQWFTSVIRR